MRKVETSKYNFLRYQGLAASSNFQSVPKERLKDHGGPCPVPSHSIARGYLDQLVIFAGPCCTCILIQPQKCDHFSSVRRGISTGTKTCPVAYTTSPESDFQI